MRRVTQRAIRATVPFLFAAGILSCDRSPTEPIPPSSAAALSRPALAALVVPSLVVSQVYGGGGNAGSVYKNDFIEIFNPGTSAVSVAGWSVQYASAAGTTWQATALAGSIPPGGYYLVQEAAGAGGTTALPTADATGAINMSATAGKVVLASQATAFASGTSCPSGVTVVDVVSFGTGNCGAPAPGPANTTLSDQRGDGGCTSTGDASADFVSATTTPRNSASPPHSCTTAPAPPATVTIAPDSTGVLAGSTVTFVATAKDADGNVVGTTFTWTSSSASVATVDANGVATGVADGLATITATAGNSVAGSAKLSVTSPSPVTSHAGEIVISQIFGAGGNAGSVFKNDYVELFNRSAQPVNVTGWSVQYASATGSFTQATPISGIIPAGGYYLVQESAGTAGTTDLPTPEATGTISMAAGSGKVLLIQATVPAGVVCPTGTAVVDQVSYGSGTNCGTTTATLSATVAALRRSGGCFYTPDAATDFSTGAPAPRNGATATHSCVVGPLDHVQITGALTVLAGASTQLTATPLDASDNTVPGATVTWATSDATIATVSATGLVTGVAANGTPATITVTVVAGAVTKTASVNIMVNTDGINWIDISSSAASFPPGFQTQLFATARTESGGTIIPATFTFEAVDPQFATALTVNNSGIITGVAAPTDGTRPGIRITAVPVGGGAPYTFISHPVTIEAPVSAPLSVYAVNDEFGDPTPASTSTPNDFLIRRAQYVLSYNQSRGTPNWVAYELDVRQMVTGQDRCNCFSADPLLPSAAQIFTSDYTSGGFDRGHMTRSADRTLANVDNATTFYLTNVVPQQGDLNQGVWAQFEDALADSARAGRAVYVITGPLYGRSHGLSFVKDQGKIAIPDSTWKIALIGPGNSGNPFTNAALQHFDNLVGLTLLAVNMPNVSGVRNDPWTKYLTTVEKIEEATGYDFLSLLQTGFQAALDYKDHPPVAAFTTSGGTTEGSSITFDASTSTDIDLTRPDLGRTEALNYAWHFSDGVNATGKTFTRTFGHGTFTATLTVTDAFGWPNSTSSSITLTNLPPTATLGAPASGLEGTAFSLALTNATDPSTTDDETLTFAFDCGTGYGAASSSPSHNCTPIDQGDITVHGKVIDAGGAFTEYTAVVHVTNAAPSATFVAPANIGTNDILTLLLTNGTDPSTADVAAGLLYAFDCGTGAGFSGASTSAGATCSTAPSGARTVRGRVTDKDGGASEYSAVVTIAAPPVATAIVRHGPTLNSQLDGSLQILTGDNVTLNSGGAVSGTLFAPGLPTVRLNGHPTIGATVDGSGSASPSNYLITLNSNSSIGTLARRTDPGVLPAVAAPDAPTGSRNVSLNGTNDPVGAWETVRNLTLNSGAGTRIIPAGAYGDIVANGSSTIVLGVAGATTPSVYHFQHLTLNGSAQLQVAGPVIVTVGNAVMLNSNAGAPGHAEWLTLKIAQGGLTLNSGVALDAMVLAPNGTVTLNSASLTGALAADRLVLNGSAVLRIVALVPVNQ